jgi:hypothetical protein
MVKRGLIILAIAAAHFFISNLVYGIGYRRTTEAIITDRAPTLFDSILGYTSEVLMFPRDALSPSIPAPSSERQLALLEWALYLGNSLFWAIALYSIIAFISHYRRTRKRKSP